MVTQLTESTYLRQYARTSFQLEREIGAGGEGRVYSISEDRLLAAKIYHHPDNEHMIKLSMMLMQPPLIPKTANNELTWPVDGIMDESGQFAGFLMPIIDKQHNVTLSQIYNPKARISTIPDFTWKNLLSTAANIAAMLAALHAANYVAGDLNESNILVNKKTRRVKLIDCDSIQVPGPDGKTFRCPVGKAEYTPPELQNVTFDAVDRLPAHDNFALAVLIFLLLMEGVHPFTGSLPASDTVPLPEDNIRQSQWPYAPDHSLQPPKHALPLDILPVRLQELMQRCFLHGNSTPQQRPTAQEWLDALNKAQTQLKCCHKNKQHWYSNHLSVCPWCKRKALIHFDSFARPVSFPPQSKPDKRKWIFSARPFPKISIRSGRTVSTRQQSQRKRVFSFTLWVVIICVITAIIAFNTHSTTSTLPTNTLPTSAAQHNSYWLTPVSTLTCPPGDVPSPVYPHNCQLFTLPTLSPEMSTVLAVTPAVTICHIKAGKNSC